jgi:hypothetical protein
MLLREKMIDIVSDIYYEPNYLQVLAKQEGAVYEVFKHESYSNIALYPFLITAVNDMGYNLNERFFDIHGAYGYNGVISNSDDPQFIHSFYDAFNQYCKEKNIIAEFTRFHPVLENHKFSQNHLQVLLDRHTVVLNIDKSYEDIWKNEYSSKNRNMIRKAEKLGYICDIVFKQCKTHVENFIDIYTANMRTVGAESFYFFSESYFYDTFELLKEYAYLFNIRSKAGQLLCSAIVFKYKEFIHYHLSGRSNDADNSVNNFLLDQVVKFGQKSDSKLFHLGGGRSNAADDTLLKFKMNFSKTTKPFYIGKKIHNQKVYDEVVGQWEAKYPEKKDKYKNHLLKYRF